MESEAINHCAYCGRDLDKLGEYRDFIHFRPDGYPCVPMQLRPIYGPDGKTQIGEIAG